MRVSRVLLLFALSLLLDSTAQAERSRPNVLLILADDLGYADLGCYGGEIQTPNVDQLAEQGLQFTHFRATSMCTTSRIALLAGMPFHAAGQETYAHSVPLPMLMRKAGYRTMMVGKWHAGTPTPQSRLMFDRSFGFLGGMTDSFAGGKDWFLDAEPFTDFGEDFYATTAFVDRSVEFMQEAMEKQQPFFMYVAFNAPHHPCQAPQKTVEKYRETFQDGYASVRNLRYQRQVQAGLVSDQWAIAESEQEVKRWEELPNHRRQIENDRMAAYAAAVDEVDQGVGRMLEFLKQAGIEQNTLVVFLSDNGGDYGNGGLHCDERQIPWRAGSNPSSSNGWATVKNTPFRYYKHACHEGGIAVPMIVRWPDGIGSRAGKVVRAPCHITDLYPTLLQLARADYPTAHRGHPVRPLTGSSLHPFLTEKGEKKSKPVFCWYRFSRAWIEDEWKVVSLYNGPWQLFDLSSDRGETKDLAKQHPKRLAAYIAKWNEFAKASDVPMSPPEADQKHWGWHRLQMVLPNLVSLSPASGTISETNGRELRLKFSKTVDFSKTDGKKIRLFEVSNERIPVWETDPSESHPCQDLQEIVFADLPALKPDQHYFVMADAGWCKIGGLPAGPLNDGAFWWRFRTPEVTAKSDSTTQKD